MSCEHWRQNNATLRGVDFSGVPFHVGAWWALSQQSPGPPGVELWKNRFPLLQAPLVLERNVVEASGVHLCLPLSNLIFLHILLHTFFFYSFAGTMVFHILVNSLCYALHHRTLPHPSVNFDCQLLFIFRVALRTPMLEVPLWFPLLPAFCYSQIFMNWKYLFTNVPPTPHQTAL